MALRHVLVGMLPKRLELPLRYWYTSAASRIDIEARLLARLIRPGSTALDIGAHAGLVSFLFAKSGAGRVHSFEPLSRWRSVLQAWADSRTDVSVHALACSDAEGEFAIHIPRTPEGNLLHSRASIERPSVPHEVERIRTTTLDLLASQLGISNVSVVKVDVEGHEDAVLRGARALLERERPTMMIEIEARHRTSSPRCAFDLLHSMQYDGYFIDEEKQVCSVANFHEEKHQSRAGAPGYINNFIFVPAGQAPPTLP